MQVVNKGAIIKMSKIIKGMLWLIGKALPIERSVYVSCFYGKGFTDNNKYII